MLGTRPVVLEKSILTVAIDSSLLAYSGNSIEKVSNANY